MVRQAEQQTSGNEAALAMRTLRGQKRRTNTPARCNPSAVAGTEDAFGNLSRTALECYCKHTTRRSREERCATNQRDGIRGLHVGQKVIFINHGGHSQLVGWRTAFNPDYSALAAHPDAFCQRDLRGQGESEVNRGASLDGRIDVEANSARAHVTGLRRVLLAIVTVTDTYRETKRESPHGPLVIVLDPVMVWLRFRH